MKKHAIVFVSLLFLNCLKAERINIDPGNPMALLGILALTQASPTSTPVSTLSNGLLSYYPFDGAANGANASDKGSLNLLQTNIGTATAATGNDGDANGAYSFNGTNQYFSNTSPTGLPWGRSLRTMCAWVNPASIPVNALQYIVAYGDTSGTPQWDFAFAIAIYIEDGNNTVNSGLTAGAYIINVKGSATVSNDNPIKVSAIPLNTWSHACAVYDGTNSILYFNGNYIGQKDFSVIDTRGTPAPKFTIGVFVSTTQNFNGRIDDVRIYDRVLTTTEITSLFNNKL